MYYVYVLESQTKEGWYIGYTANLRTRVKRHNAHGNVSTAHKGPWTLIYYEAYLCREDALGREKFLKSGSGWKFLKKQLRHHCAAMQ
jgi:putative endonuclease